LQLLLTYRKKRAGARKNNSKQNGAEETEGRSGKEKKRDMKRNTRGKQCNYLTDTLPRPSSMLDSLITPARAFLLCNLLDDTYIYILFFFFNINIVGKFMNIIITIIVVFFFFFLNELQKYFLDLNTFILYSSFTIETKFFCCYFYFT
jgi:hypothetical protein